MSTSSWAILGLIVVALAVFLKARSVDKQDFQQLVNDGALLVDVRTPKEFAQGHIPGALNIPVDQVTARLTEFGSKDGAVVVYCRSGARSGRAKGVLEQAGFSSVYNLGPMSAW